MKRFLTATATTLLATITMLAPGTVATAGSEPLPPTKLRVMVGPSKMVPEVVSADLTCDPPDGTHPYAKEACADLEAAKGDISAVPPRAAACPSYVDPVEISVVGTWRGEQVDFREMLESSNPMCARLAHGYIFSVGQGSPTPGPA